MAMRRRTRALAATLATVFAIMASFFAASGPASAAQPLVVDSCATTVQGQPGQPLQLSPNAVVQPIVDIVTAVPLLGPPLAQPFRVAFTALPPIPLGTVHNGDTMIPGSTVADAVVHSLSELPLLGTVFGTIEGTVRQTLSTTCSVLVHSSTETAPGQGSATPSGAGSPSTAPATTAPNGNAPSTAKPGQDTRAPGQSSAAGNGSPSVSGAGQPTTEPVLPNYDYGRAPMTDYSSIPFAQAGQYTPAPDVRYGNGVPGDDPSGTSRPGQAVQAAGHAEALSPDPKGIGNPLPVLLAVLALSGVTAALVRTWVLRRS
jgi:hypothetical protein